MEAKTRRYRKLETFLTAGLLAAIILGFFVANLFYTPPEVSASERRRLAPLPELVFTSGGRCWLNDDFAGEFEAYAQDSFVGRDALRALKAFVQYEALRLLDNNGLFRVQGSVAKLTFLDEASVRRTIAKINKVAARLPHGTRIYLAAIPDKSYYLAAGTAYPGYDYDALEALIRENLADARYISLKNALGADSYYTTDLHWKQTALSPVLQALGVEMGFSMDENFTAKELSPFYGAYAGQYALPLPAEALACLTNETLSRARVRYLDTKTLKMVEGAMYDEVLFDGVDPYSVYLRGPQPIVIIENPDAATGKELYLFRDSFSSSLAPLLTEAYAKITLIDLRYISADALFSLIDFQENADVLFLYGSLILNDSTLLLVG
ncbi:MAG TPA: hypothetical protein VN540_04150 [Clostridia bacterium]|nr:hypothetical protein [Clostridia bacterium]